MKSVKRVIYILFTCVMLVIMGYGGYGLVTAPALAKQAEEEIEEMLRLKQEEAERLLEEQRRAQEEQRQREAELKLLEAENNAMQEDGYNPATLYRQYSDASEMRVVGIGDSVMLAALSELYATFPNGYFDAVFGRTLYEGVNVLYQLEEEGNLGDVIVFSLGTNSYITEEDCENLIAHSGGRPTFWLSTFGVANDSTQVMSNVVARHDDAYMIDWGTLAKANQAEYILRDGLHPTTAGSQAYAEFIRQQITEAVLQGPTIQIEEGNLNE